MECFCQEHNNTVMVRFERWTMRANRGFRALFAKNNGFSGPINRTLPFWWWGCQSPLRIHDWFKTGGRLPNLDWAGNVEGNISVSCRAFHSMEEKKGKTQ